MKKALLFSTVLLFLCGFTKKSGPGDATATPSAPAAKVYDVDAVSKDLRDANVTTDGTQQDFKAFFATHPNYQLCTDNDAFSVGVIRNKKADPKADDIFIVANYRDGKIGGLDITPQMFSVSNLTRYCK